MMLRATFLELKNPILLAQFIHVLKFSINAIDFLTISPNFIVWSFLSTAVIF
jgi:hypothetical protein